MHKLENAQINVADVNVDFFQQGKSYYEQKNFGLAFQCFSKALPAWIDIEICHSPELSENLFFYAISAINCAYTDEKCVDYLRHAISHFSQSNHFNPANVFLSSYYLGAIANQSDSGEEVASYYFVEALKLLNTYPSSQLALDDKEYMSYKLSILFCLVELFFTLKKYNEAVNILHQIKEIKTEKELQNNFRTHYVKITLFEGLIKFYQGEYDGAIDILLAFNELSESVSGQKTGEQDNDEWHFINQAFFIMGQCYFKNKDFNRALQTLSLIPYVSPLITFTEYTPAENGIYRDYLCAKALYREDKIHEAYNTIKSLLTKVRSIDGIDKSLYLQVMYFASQAIDQYNKTSGKDTSSKEIYDLETPIQLLEECLPVSSIDPVKHAKIHLQLGEDSCLTGQHVAALQYLSVPYHYYNNQLSINEKLLYTRTLLAQGISANSLKQFQTAKFYLEKATEVNKDEIAGLNFAMEIFLQLGKCCNALGEYYLQLGKGCNALDEFKEAATHLHSCMVTLGKLDLKEKENKIVMAAVCQQLGLSLCRQNLFEKASSFLEASVVVFKDNNDELEMASTYIGLALCHYQINNIEKSNEFSQEALRIIRAIRKKDPDNFDSRYIPVLKCWLSEYVYDKGIGAIASFLKIIKMKETEEILKELQKNPQKHGLYVPPENLKLYNQLKMNGELKDEHLGIISRFDEAVIQYYNKNFSITKKPLLIINLISALQTHYENTGLIAFPALLQKNNCNHLLLKFDNKTKLLVENPDSVWVKNFKTEEIKHVDYRTLTELNILPDDRVEEIINIWHGDEKRGKFSNEDFSLLKFIVENKLQAGPTNNTLTVVKNIRSLQYQIDSKTRQSSDLYLQDIEKKLEASNQGISPRVIDTIWDKLVVANSLKKKDSRAHILLTSLFVHWQQSNIVTVPYVFTLVKDGGHNFSTMKINRNLSHILYHCPDARWLRDVTFAEIDAMRNSTFLAMVNELTCEEIIEIIKMWRTQRLEPFAPHAEDYESLKLQLLINKNLEEIEQGLTNRLQQLEEKLIKLKPPSQSNENKKQAENMKNVGFHKRKGQDDSIHQEPVFKRERPTM